MDERFKYIPPAGENGPAGGTYWFSYKLSKEEAAHVFSQIMWVHRKISPSAQSIFPLLVTAVPLFVVIKIAAMLMREQFLLPVILFGLAGAFGLTALFLKLREYGELKYQTFVDQVQTPPEMENMWDLTFSDESIRVVSGLGAVIHPWNAYSYLFETTDAYYLVHLTGERKEKYTAVPKSCLGSRDQQKFFADFCMDHGLSCQFVRAYESKEDVKASGRLVMVAAFFSSVLLLTMTVSLLYFDLVLSYIMV